MPWGGRGFPSERGREIIFSRSKASFSELFDGLKGCTQRRSFARGLWVIADLGFELVHGVTPSHCQKAIARLQRDGVALARHVILQEPIVRTDLLVQLRIVAEVRYQEIEIRFYNAH